MIRDGIPAEWVIGLFMTAVLGLFLFVAWLVKLLTSSASSASSAITEHETSSADTRSAKRSTWRKVRRSPLGRSGTRNVVPAHQNAGSARSDNSGSRSDVQHNVPLNLPGAVTPDELTCALMAVYYRVNNLVTSKEAAIKASFPGSPTRGGSDAWKRASLAYDLVYTSDAKATQMRDKLASTTGGDDSINKT